MLVITILATASARRRLQDLAVSRWPPNRECDGEVCSEQVHIALGGPGEMVVTFMSNSMNASFVRAHTEVYVPQAVRVMVTVTAM